MSRSNPEADTPLLLVDIDGVLAPYGFDRPPSGFEPFELFLEDAEPTFLSEAHGEWLRALSNVYDMVWASAGGHRANKLLAPVLGLPDWPHVPYPQHNVAPAEKVPAIDAFLGDRTCACLEDRMTPEAYRWAAQRFTCTLLIHIEPTVGLTLATVDRLLNWAGHPGEGSR